jgi:hypothetical protein
MGERRGAPEVSVCKNLQLAATALALAQATTGIAILAYGILDGMVAPIDRLSGPADRRYYPASIAVTA